MDFSFIPHTNLGPIPSSMDPRFFLVIYIPGALFSVSGSSIYLDAMHIPLSSGYGIALATMLILVVFPVILGMLLYFLALDIYGTVFYFLLKDRHGKEKALKIIETSIPDGDDFLETYRDFFASVSLISIFLAFVLAFGLRESFRFREFIIVLALMFIYSFSILQIFLMNFFIVESKLKKLEINP